MASPAALLEKAREKRPALDHLVRAFGRYSADAGDRQAASVTFFGFLSFFPILALATTVLSYVLGDAAVDTVVEQVDSYAPGLAEQLQLRDILSADRAAGLAGVLSLLGLLYSGLGWVDAMREAIRAIWHHNVKEGNFVVKKAKDVLILLGLGATILLSVGISAATGAFTGFAFEQLGVDKTFVALGMAKLLGVALGVLTSAALFLFLFWRLPKVQSPFRRVVKGALLAAVLFEVLKRVGAFYIERTTENPIYGIFAVVVGLLVWINIVSRMLLLCAAWTVTAPYDSDIEPSGTANAEAARKAGIPTEFADEDPDNPPSLQEDGAPSPLAAAVQGATPSQDVPEGRGADAEDEDDPDAAPARSGRRVEALKERQDGSQEPSRSSRDSGRDGARRPVGAGARSRSAADGPARTEVVVRQAAQFGVGLVGVAVLAVALHLLGTLRGLLRR